VAEKKPTERVVFAPIPTDFSVVEEPASTVRLVIGRAGQEEEELALFLWRGGWSDRYPGIITWSTFNRLVGTVQASFQVYADGGCDWRYAETRLEEVCRGHIATTWEHLLAMGVKLLSD